MSEERFKEVFRRLTSETPEAPTFSDLELHQATPTTSLTFKPWMVAVGVSLLVMVVVGALGLTREGGSDLAAPDEGLIDYVKLEYSATANPVCEGGTIVDNGGFDDATIEIWGPNRDALTLMVATFPDGSTERTIIEGDPWRPVRSWVNDPASYPDNTQFRIVRCEGTGSDELILLTGFTEPRYGSVIPLFFLAPPDETFGETFRDTEPEVTVWNGINALRYSLFQESETATQSIDVYVADDDTTLLRQTAEIDYVGIGKSEIDITLVERDRVTGDSVSYDVAGLTAIEFDQVIDLGREQCPVTVPAQSFSPPDPWRAERSDPGQLWFGKDELWTVLSADGSYLPRKSLWWSVNYRDPGLNPQPDLTVRWILLNSTREMVLSNGDPATNGSTSEDGVFMIGGIDPDIKGCWEVTAIFEGASLTYIYYNDDGRDPNSVVVPDVVGMTVERARNVLHDSLYEPSFFDSSVSSYVVCAQEPAAGTELNPWETVGMRTAPDGECGELMNPSLDFNPDFAVYTDENGWLRYRTACPAADVVVATGMEGADALPHVSGTSREVVEAFVVSSIIAAEVNENDYYLSRVGLVDIEVVPRNGEVWYEEDGKVIVSQQPDFMVKGTITEDFQCPSSPVFYEGGISIAYVLDTND